jgi:hypothetical protein
MKEQQNVRPLAPVEDFERVKQELLQKLRLWRTTVIAGAAVAALVPAAVFADAELTGNAGGGIPQQVQSLLATVTTNSSQIAALQGSDASQNAQLAQLQQQLQTQSAAIAALQAQLKDETAARQAGEATGKAYTDTETDRAKSAEGALTTALASVDNTATLNAAKAYTDAEMTRASAAESGIHDALTAEIAARKQGDADTLAAATLHTDTAVAAETTRATAAEGTLTSLLNNEIARATAAEQAAILTAVGNVEANLTAMAKSPFGGNPAGPQAFWDQIQQGLFG